MHPLSSMDFFVSYKCYNKCLSEKLKELINNMWVFVIIITIINNK